MQGNGEWDIRFTPQARAWLESLGPRESAQVRASLSKLREHGPSLGYPAVGGIRRSRFHTMKEIRSIGGHHRALFSFDPNRTAIVLVGGDKTNDWKGWYERNIKVADKLFDQHLRKMGKEGSCTRATTRAGTRSNARSR